MKKRLLLLATIALLFAGCVKDVSETLSAGRSAGPEPTLAEQGANVEENVNGLEQTQAIADSILVAWGLDSVALEPTDLYVRFLVKTEEEYDLLAALPDSLELFDFPFHLDLTPEQMEAFANDDSAGGYWFYATVPLDFVFPQEIQYEELDQMYLQRLGTQGAQLPDEVWEAMLEAMFADADNGGPLTRAQPYHPYVTLTYKSDHPTRNDTVVGLEGVKVRFWVGGISGKAYTNANGEIRTVYRDIGGRFTAKVNSQIIWENSRWNIRSGAVTQAKTWGQTKSRAHWKKTFGGDTKTINHVYATVHKALYTYFYKSKTLEFAKDIRISSEKKMNTRVFDEVGKADYYDYGADINNRIRIWGKHKNDDTGKVEYRPYWETEQIVYHELGHASHHELIGHTAYRDRNEHTKEPYAEFVSNCFMRSLYPRHIQGYHGVEGQRSGDDDNPEWYNGLGEWLWYQGFTIAQIQNIMKGKTIDAWKNTAQSYNVTDPVIVDAVFKVRWRNWRYDAKHLMAKDTPTTIFPGAIMIYENPEIVIPQYYPHSKIPKLPYPYPNMRAIAYKNWVYSDKLVDIGNPIRKSFELNLIFSEPGVYDITRNVDLAMFTPYYGQFPYSQTITITVIPYRPILESYARIGESSATYAPAYFRVTNPLAETVVYEWVWYYNGELFDTLDEQGIDATVTAGGGGGGNAYMKCRAILSNGTTSEWSDPTPVNWIR